MQRPRAVCGPADRWVGDAFSGVEDGENDDRHMRGEAGEFADPRRRRLHDERIEIRLTVVDRADGTVRRSFGDADLPVENEPNDTEVFLAPGAVVVRGSHELMAIG